ncbi:MAG TPA: hypothetical protein VF988_13540, partial [Verrucomicrobiae bacterium]
QPDGNWRLESRQNPQAGKPALPNDVVPVPPTKQIKIKSTIKIMISSVALVLALALNPNLNLGGS